jgi:N6-adenosine-specific RNA methylase IME4
MFLMLQEVCNIQLHQLETFSREHRHGYSCLCNALGAIHRCSFLIINECGH